MIPAVGCLQMEMVYTRNQNYGRVIKKAAIVDNNKPNPIIKFLIASVFLALPDFNFIKLIIEIIIKKSAITIKIPYRIKEYIYFSSVISFVLL